MVNQYIYMKSHIRKKQPIFTFLFKKWSKKHNYGSSLGVEQNVVVRICVILTFHLILGVNLVTIWEFQFSAKMVMIFEISTPKIQKLDLNYHIFEVKPPPHPGLMFTYFWGEKRGTMIAYFHKTCYVHISISKIHTTN